jgi:hypothetical protein
VRTQAVTSEYHHSLAQGGVVEPYHTQEFPSPARSMIGSSSFVGEWETDMECCMNRDEEVCGYLDRLLQQLPVEI